MNKLVCIKCGKELGFSSGFGTAGNVYCPNCAQAEEKNEFLAAGVFLLMKGDRETSKIQYIKRIREATGLGLVECKNLFESLDEKYGYLFPRSNEAYHLERLLTYKDK